jgi:hypothetical protein
LVIDLRFGRARNGTVEAGKFLTHLEAPVETHGLKELQKAPAAELETFLMLLRRTEQLATSLSQEI